MGQYYLFDGTIKSYIRDFLITVLHKPKQTSMTDYDELKRSLVIEMSIFIKLCYH